MNVEEILIEWLTEHGYDGLANDDCGCGIDDLLPCGSISDRCEAAYKVPADAEFKEEFGEDAEWMYSTKKPEESNNGA